jgi:hypothetical protein
MSVVDDYLGVAKPLPDEVLRGIVRLRVDEIVG